MSQTLQDLYNTGVQANIDYVEEIVASTKVISKFMATFFTPVSWNIQGFNSYIPWEKTIVALSHTSNYSQTVRIEKEVCYFFNFAWFDLTTIPFYPG